MKNVTRIFSVFILISFVSCEKSNSPEIANENINPPQIELKTEQVVESSNRFGIDLFKAVSANSDENLMLSPLSAGVALTMLLNGCNENTYNQIHQMLYYNNLNLNEINKTYQKLLCDLLSSDTDIKVAIANSSWCNNNFNVKERYSDTLQSVFSAHIQSLDFGLSSSLDTINHWAFDNTFGKIPVILDELKSEDVMFLMNALYFKGNWTNPFDIQNTQYKAFYTLPGNPVQTMTMLGQIKLKIFEGDGYLAVELPYGNANYSMVILLPENDLDSCIHTLNFPIWKQITNYFDTTNQISEVRISLPRFTFSCKYLLNDQLKALGMTEAFSPNLANLSGISDAPIYVSLVSQDAFIEVNEKGTEGAAITIIEITYGEPDYEEIKINKPFLFAIREKTTQTLLFIGKVVRP